ncbi:MAG: hypothetical protein WCH39_29395, partial [Schlesneria sp.]
MQSFSNSGEVARTRVNFLTGEQSPKPYEIWEMVEVARSRANFSIKTRGGGLSSIFCAFIISCFRDPPGAFA